MRRHPKKFAVRPAQNANSEINVTPLVDVVLVLLIIFMVVTHLLEKDIPVRTPKSETIEEVEDIPPDQLVIYVYKDGSLRLNTERVDSAQLVARLKSSLDRKPNPHLGFGLGLHRCVGSHLAKLQLQVALTEFLGRYREFCLDPAGRIELSSGLGQGLISLPLTLGAVSS